jgi:hypothetical protein
MSNVRKSGKGAATGTVQFKRMAAMAALGVVATSAGQQARAADWIVADDNWTNPAAWSTAAVPGPTEPAFINFVGGVAHVNTDLVDDAYTVRVQNGATLSIEPGGDLRTTVGNSTPTLVNDPLFATRIGDGSAGTLSIKDGTFVNIYTNGTANQSADTYIGVNAGAGTLTKTGALSVLTTRDLRIGSGVGGTGTATVSGGAVNTNFVIIGHEGGSGSVAFSGGTMSAIGQINVAQSGNLADTNGTLVQTGGTMVSTSVIAVGRGGTSTATNRGFGTFTLDGGQVTANFTGVTTTNGHFVVGMNGGKGTMTWNAGNVTTQGGFYVAYNDGGNVNNRSEGSLAMHGGTATVGGMFHVGYAAASGTMTMDGGTINATGVSGVGSEDRTNNSRATLTTGPFTQTAGTIASAGGFTVATGAGTGNYSIGGTAVLTAGTGTTGNLTIGGPDQVNTVHTSLGTMTIADTASVTVAGLLRMGQTGGDASLTMTGGTLSVTGNSLVADSGTTLTIATVATPNPANATFNVNGGSASFTGNLTVGDGANTNGNLNVTAGTLNVGGTLVAGRQTTNSGQITQTGGTINAGSVGIRTGTGTVAATKYSLSGGTLNVTGAVTANSLFEAKTTGVANVGGAISGNGSMTVADTAAVNAASVRLPTVTMTGGTVKIAETTTGTATGVSNIPALSLSGTAKFDLTDNKLVTNVPVGTGVAGGGNYTADSVSRYVQTASNGGAWDGPGITTSKGDAQAGLTSIGVALASDVRDFGLGTTLLFAGQTITPTNTLAMYTYAGDANLDGTITGDDYSGIDFAIQDPSNTGGWFNGDFNYDGAVTGDDYSAIDFNILAQGAPFTTAAGLSGVSAVPEPASLALVASAAGGLLLRRRRSQRGG